MTTVSIHIQANEKDIAETDRLSRELRRELLALDVDDVALARGGEAPAGAKGDPVTVGMLVVSLANSAGLVGICQVVRTWVNRDRGRRIVMKEGKRTLQITGANAAQHQQIIDAFLAEKDKRDI
jgi:hypothetical protein